MGLHFLGPDIGREMHLSSEGATSTAQGASPAILDKIDPHSPERVEEMVAVWFQWLYRRASVTRQKMNHQIETNLWRVKFCCNDTMGLRPWLLMSPLQGLNAVGGSLEQ